MTDIAKAIKAINNSAEFSVNEEDINQITWHNETTPIAKQTILNKQTELQALEDVYEKRRKEYGTVVSQLDEIYHNGMDSWKARIAQIKADNPKE
jgi:L-lysine 2,3-aminomutase